MTRAFTPLPEFDRQQLRERGGFARLFESRTPAVLRGVAKDWPIMRTWSREHLATHYGDFECTIVRDSRPDLAEQRCTLATYFAEHAHLSTMTIVGLAARDEYRFFEDVPLPNTFFARDDLSAFFLFHSNLDGGSLPHCHQDAFNILPRGRKRWMLWDAHPEREHAGHAQLARCLETYGKGRRVKEWFDEGLDELDEELVVYETVQAAGDVVYVPMYFAHAAINLSETLGIVAVVDRPGVPYQRNAQGRHVLPGRKGECSLEADAE